MLARAAIKARARAFESCAGKYEPAVRLPSAYGWGLENVRAFTLELIQMRWLSTNAPPSEYQNPHSEIRCCP